MNNREEQYQKILKAFPEASFVRNSIYHLKIPVRNEVLLDINYKNYPKRPKAKLVKNNGNSFKLYKVISSLRDWYKETSPSILELIKEIFLTIDNIILNQILVNREFINGLMDLCKKAHPKKLVGLLGVRKGIVTEYILPSRTCTDPIKPFEVISCSIPLDLSYEGTFMSRPSSELSSNEKLNKIFKKRRFTMLLAHPYDSADCIRCFDTVGNILELIIVD